MKKQKISKEEKLKLEKNIPKFYAYKFLRECIFWIPIITLFWQNNGLSLTQIMILQALFAAGIFILEVPTGALADKIGRKYTLILSGIFSIIGFSVYAIGGNFWHFLIAELILAFAATFMSGADSAFIYDSLKQIKKEAEFKKIMGNAKSLAFLAAAISSTIGGFIAVYSLRATFVASIATLFFMFLISLNFNEPKTYGKINKSYQKHILESFKEAWNNKELLFLLLFYAFVSLFARINLWFYQPYMKESGLALVLFGIVWASFNLFAIIGSKFAHNVEKYLGEKNSLYFIAGGIALTTFLMGNLFAIIGIGFILLQQFIRGFNSPVLEDYTHKHLESHNRATLMSIQGMLASFMFFVLGPVFGWIADKFSLGFSLKAAGISAIVAFSLLFIWRAKNNNHKIKNSIKH
jgi:MFS family permease